MTLIALPLNFHGKVSIVVPVHGTLANFANCLASLEEPAAQGAQIILVIDGPNPVLEEAAQHFSTQHPNVDVLHREHAGPGAARNAGIERSTNEYLYFLDADDALRTREFGLAAHEFLDYSPDIVRCGGEVQVSRLSTRDAIEVKRRIYDPPVLSSVCLLGSSLERFLRCGRNIATSPGLHFFRRAFIEEHHLRFSLKYPEEDIEFTSLAYAFSKSLVLSRHAVFDRFLRAGSLSRRKLYWKRLPYVRLVWRIFRQKSRGRGASASRALAFTLVLLAKEISRTRRIRGY